MEIEQNILDSNRGLLESLAADLRLSRNELEQKMKLVAAHDQLLAMSGQVNKVYQTNPKAFVNFGEFGENIARQLNLEPELMYQAVLTCGYNELLLNLVVQLNTVYKSPKQE